MCPSYSYFFIFADVLKVFSKSIMNRSFQCAGLQTQWTIAVQSEQVKIMLRAVG